METIISNDKMTGLKIDRAMTINELVEYLPFQVSRSSIYDWINDRHIPYWRDSKDRIRFKTSEIDLWLARGRMTEEEFYNMRK